MLCQAAKKEQEETTDSTNLVVMKEDTVSTGLVGMVRSVTRSLPANLSVGPFSIDTRNYANTLVNLCRHMFINWFIFLSSD